MFVLIEISEDDRSETTKIEAYGPFATRNEAISFYIGDAPSVLRAKFGSDQDHVTINDTTVMVIELNHPTQ